MKRFLLVSVALVGALCFADVPAWLKKPEKEFPTAAYIRAIGEGDSAKAARAAALSDISLFFDTKTEVITQAVKQSGAVISGDTSFFESNHSYQQIAQISSEAEFFCVNFTEPYRNEKTGVYSVLAYINKKEAAQVYTARINALMDSVNAYRTYAKGEKEPFRAVQALQKAQVISSLAGNYIKAETTIVPQDAQKFQRDLQTIALIPAERAALKKNMTFAITMNQKDKRFDPIFSTVAAVLEKQGYAYSVSDAQYAVIVDISCAEESYDAGMFVRPSVDVLIVDANGAGLYTYSKALPRTGGKSIDQAYTRAVVKIKQDLEAHFLEE